jgi:hypothetical protein
VWITHFNQLACLKTLRDPKRWTHIYDRPSRAELAVNVYANTMADPHCFDEMGLCPQVRPTLLLVGLR